MRLIPCQIGSQENVLLLLALRRLDPAIQWADIHMRMPYAGRPRDLSYFDRCVQTHYAHVFYLIPWHDLVSKDSGVQRRAYIGSNNIKFQLPPQAVAKNSTRYVRVFGSSLFL